MSTAIDRDGHHWEQHGKSVAIARPGVLEATTACTLAAHSMRHPRILQGRVHVLLEAGKDPFTLAARMTALSPKAERRGRRHVCKMLGNQPLWCHRPCTAGIGKAFMRQSSDRPGRGVC